MGVRDSDIGYILIFFVLSCIFFWKVLLNPGKMIFAEYHTDIVSQVSPYRNFITESWRKDGKLPLWNPYIYMGHPFVGLPLSSMFYPLNFLYLFFSVDLLFGYMFLVEFFLTGAFMYLFAKSLGIQKVSAILAGIVFMFSGFFVASMYTGHPYDLDIVSLLPLAFLFLEKTIKKKSLFYAALTGAVIGLQFLGGNVEIWFYNVVGLFLYFLIRLIFTFKESKNLKQVLRLLTAFVIICIVIVGVSAIQFFPTFEISILSSRYGRGSYEFSSGYSLPPQQLISLLMPEIFGTFLDNTYWGARNFWALCAYVGILPLIFAAISMFKRNKYIWSFFTLAVFALLYAFGKYAPVHMFFYKMPFFSMFRRPSNMLFLFIFSVSVMSGFGLDITLEDTSMSLKKRLWFMAKLFSVVCVITAVSIVVLYLQKDAVIEIGKDLLIKKYKTFTETVHPLRYDLEFYMEKVPEAYWHIVGSMSSFLVILLSVVGLLAAKNKQIISDNQFKLFVILIVLLDLWYFGMKYVDVIDPDIIFNKNEVIDFLEQAEEFFRIIPFSGAPHYMGVRYGIEYVQGYESVRLKRYNDFIMYLFGEPHEWEMGPVMTINKSKIYEPKILGLLNVKYILLDNQTTVFNLNQTLSTPVYDKYLPTNETQIVYIYQNPQFLPRAYVVPNAKVITGDEKILEEINSDEFNPKEFIILEKDVDMPLINPGIYKEATITHYSPDEITVDVYMDSPGFLVLSENYYPGWKAYDNDEELEIFRTNYILRSVYLTEGQHTVKFVYNPFSFRFGLSVTVITMLSLCALVLHKIKSNLQKDGE